MKNIYLLCVCFFNFQAILFAAETAKSNCLEKEKTLALLETAENFLTKARDAYPSCQKNLNSTDAENCDQEKSLAYIEISKKLIADVKENFPSCNKPAIDDDNDVIDDHRDNIKEEKSSDCSEILANGSTKSGVYTIWPSNKPVIDDEDDLINHERDNIKEEKNRDCSEILASGRIKSGVYTIWPSNFPAEKPLKVYCDMDTNGGEWTVIQRRGKFPVQQDFFLDWESYKNGFGNLTQEFWLGNENIRLLCLKGCEIRFDLVDKDGVKYFALYEKFNLTGDRYTIEIGGYSGNAIDTMQYINRYEFSTKDKDSNERAKDFMSGWWHGYLNYCNLNGIYEADKRGKKHVYWWKKDGDLYNLSTVEIKVKPKRM